MSFVYVSFVASKDDEVSPLQLHLLNQSSRQVKDTVSKLATEHKELHGGISKIGKAVDRVSNLLYTVVTWGTTKLSEQVVLLANKQ